MTKSMTKQHIRGSVSNSSYFLCVIHFRCVIQIIYMPYRGGGGGMARTTAPGSEHELLEDVLYNGDPVLIKKDNKCVIAQIKTIEMANKVVKYYQISDQDHPTLQLEVQELNFTEVDRVYRWGGSYLDNMFTVKGEFATPVKPDIDLNAPEGMANDHVFI